MGTFGEIDERTFKIFTERVGSEVKAKNYLTKATKRLNTTANFAIGQAKALTKIGIYPKSAHKTGGTLKRSWSRTGVTYSNRALSVKISNSQHYASFVEYGHRTRNGGWVMGRGMLKKALEETERVKLNATMQRELDGYLNKLLGGK